MTESRVDRLAAALAETMGEPLADPMAAEWIAVPSAGMQRWLRLELARRLGSSGPGRTDGIAANLDLFFPGTLNRRILLGQTAADDDPWQVDRVAWAVLDVLENSDGDEVLRHLTDPAPGVSRWRRARRCADLFDRYGLHRPDMVVRWQAGEDLDGAGNPLPPRAAWQPHLWRLVRARIGQPSGAESMRERLDAIRADGSLADVPARISLFGITTIPGGSPFLEMLDALATRRQVDLYLHHPSPALATEVIGTLPQGGPAPRDRIDDTSIEVTRHPLLRSWGRPAREAIVLLGARPARPTGTGRETADDHPADQTSLLARIQADIREDMKPAGDFTPDTHDRSVRIHSCHGPTRQVEVVRDQILHLLADDPSLAEEDIVVMCPVLDEFAPLIESVFGPSATEGPPRRPAGVGPGEVAPPAIRYRVTDRSLRTTLSLLGSVGALVELLGSRFSDAALLEFANLEPVRTRFRLDDDDLSRLAGWVDQAHTSWGLDGPHRSRWGIPDIHTNGSWRAALDRLMMGIAVSEDPSGLALGSISPIAVEGSDIAVAGRFADLLGRLTALADAATEDRDIRAWMDLLGAAAEELFEVDDSESWQRSRLTRTLAEVIQAATVGGETCGVPLGLADVRHLLGARLGATAGRPDFFRGGVTFSSLTPLRGIPFRAVILLGMDEASFAAGSPDGDDLVSAVPRTGDRDRRTDARAALLDSVLAAGSNLVIVRSDRSVVTNQEVPPAVVVSELREVVASTLAPECREASLGRIEVRHPRQSFDARNFVAAPGAGNQPGLDGPWGFDPLARDAAEARASGQRQVQMMREPLEAPDTPVIALEDLRQFLVAPVKFFMRRVLGVSVPDTPERQPTTGSMGPPDETGVPRAAAGRELLVELDHLEDWQLKDRLLQHLADRGDPDWFTATERARDSLPAGRLGDDALEAARDKVLPLLDARAALGLSGQDPESVPVDLLLADGTRIIGTVRDDRGSRPGPVTVTVSAFKHKQRLLPWLDMIALTAADPTRDWQAALLNCADSKRGYQLREFAIPSADTARRREVALESLALVVDLFRRGHREPLPLFPAMSPELQRKGKPGSTWSGFSRGDGDDELTQLAFGHATVDEILAIPARDDDPPGESDGRAQRYADHLWGAIDQSMAEPEADPSGGTP